MSWTFTCECGSKVAAETEDELVLAVQAHVAESHPAVGIVPSPTDVLSMGEKATDEEAASGSPPEAALN